VEPTVRAFPVERAPITTTDDADDPHREWN
jgi:hypothetical protein